MSKIREDVPLTEGDLSWEAEGDLAPFVVFTQTKPGARYVYAGWVDAADPAMAVQFAREHYGQDQECVSIWAIPGAAVASSDRPPAPVTGGPARSWRVFIQTHAGDFHVDAGAIDATDAAGALGTARERVPKAADAHCLWVAPEDAIAATDQDDLIWRLTDQSYRLARGYSGEVRRKWEKIREQRAIEEYEKDDLKETF